jgi:hypothetical protein
VIKTVVLHLTIGSAALCVCVENDSEFTLLGDLEANAPENSTRIPVEQAHFLDLVHDAIILRDMQDALPAIVLAREWR